MIVGAVRQSLRLNHLVLKLEGLLLHWGIRRNLGQTRLSSVTVEILLEAEVAMISL
jgi:hypothetical protein